MMNTHTNNGAYQSDLVELLRPSPIFAFVVVFPLIAISLAALVSTVLFYSLFILVSVTIGSMAFYRYLSITRTRYILTRHTIVVRTGILARKYDNLELYRVKDLIVSQSIFERIFGLMTIRIHSTDLSTNILNLQGVPLSNISETIRDLVHTARLNNRIFEIN